MKGMGNNINLFSHEDLISQTRSYLLERELVWGSSVAMVKETWQWVHSDEL